MNEDIVQCPECHPGDEKDTHQWLDDLHDELTTQMGFEPEMGIPGIRNAYRGRGVPRRGRGYVHAPLRRGWARPRNLLDFMDEDD